MSETQPDSCRQNLCRRFATNTQSSESGNELDNSNKIRLALSFTTAAIVNSFVRIILHWAFSNFRVDREVWRGTALESCDTRYFVTSLDPETVLPTDLQSFTRGHWQVENCLHHIKDRTLNEDSHSIRRSGLGPRILKIRDAGVSVLHLFRKTGGSIREIAETIHFRPQAVLQLLGFVYDELCHRPE